MRIIAAAVAAMFLSVWSYAGEVVTCPAPSQYKAIAGQHPLEVDGWRALDVETMFMESPVEVADANALSYITIIQNYATLRAKRGIDFNSQMPVYTDREPYEYFLNKTHIYTYYVLCTYDDKTKYLIYKLPATLEECVVTSTGMNCK